MHQSQNFSKGQLESLMPKSQSFKKTKNNQAQLNSPLLVVGEELEMRDSMLTDYEDMGIAN